MSGEEVNQNFLLSNGKRVLRWKNTLCHVLSAFCRCGTAIDSQPPSEEQMTHLFAANSCGERRHTTLPADPISPALPVLPLGTFPELPAVQRFGQHLPALPADTGPCNTGPALASERRKASGGRKGWRGQGLRANTAKGNETDCTFPEEFTGKVLL